MAHYNDINKANNKKPRSSHDNSTGRGSDNPYKNAERLQNPTYTGTLSGKPIDPYSLASGLSPDRLGNSLQFSGKEEGMPFDLESLNTLGDSDSTEEESSAGIEDRVNVTISGEGLPRNEHSIKQDKDFKDTAKILKDSSLASGNMNSNGLGGVNPETQSLLDRVGEILDVDNIEAQTLTTQKPSNSSIALRDAFSTALKNSELPVDPQDFFSNSSLGEFLGSDPELYKNLSLTPEAANRMRSHLAAIKHGTYASVPLICKGYNSCPIRSSCWFVNKREDGNIDLSTSNFPILQPCPVEASILQVKVKQYCTEHFHNLNHITPTIITLATKLAELDIYEIRVNMLLAQGDSLGEGRDLMQEMVMSADLHGNPVKTAMREHPAFSLKERFQKMRSTLMKELLSTPEAKINAKAKMDVNKAESVSSTMTRMSAALSKINSIIRDNNSDPFDYDDD
jgi:hypothetical protein